jgi:hypothetical protein
MPLCYSTFPIFSNRKRLGIQWNNVSPIEADLTSDTLQQWAAQLLGTETSLDPWMGNIDSGPSSNVTSTTSPDPLLAPLNRRPSLQTDPTYRPLLTHYQDCLSRLVACNPDDPTNGFDAFTTLASATASTPSGQALHLATLAWAGVHMSNQGQSEFEARSERAAERARAMLFGSELPSTPLVPTDMNARFDKLSILGGLLMLMSFKASSPVVSADADMPRRYMGLSRYLTALTRSLFGALLVDRPVGGAGG